MSVTKSWLARSMYLLIEEGECVCVCVRACVCVRVCVCVGMFEEKIKTPCANLVSICSGHLLSRLSISFAFHVIFVVCLELIRTSY